MRTTIARALLSFSLASAIALPAARADDKAAAASKAEEASARFKSGVSFYKDKDFTAAMVEFKKAYELLPNYNVLYNIGQTAREQKDYASALTAFDQYLRDGGAKVAPARKKEVQAAIEELKHKVGRVKITANVEGAQILVDDVAVGKAPLPEALTVNVGRRKFAASLSGYVPVQRVVEVAGTEEATVSLELAKVEPLAPQVDPPKDTPPPSAIPRIVPWITLSVTGAAVIVTGVMGGLAVSARGDLSNELGKYPGDGQAISAAQSRTRTFAVTTDVMMGVSIAGAAATGVLFVLGRRGSHPDPEKDKPAARVVVWPGGAGVRGVF